MATVLGLALAPQSNDVEVERAGEWAEGKLSRSSFDKRWSDSSLYADSHAKIMSYAVVDIVEAKKWQPRIIVLGNNNAILKHRGR